MRGFKHPLSCNANKLTDRVLSTFDKKEGSQNGCHISQLPVELLTEILAYIVLADQPSIFTLTATCQHWRDLCILQPRFWYTVRIGNHPLTLVQAKILTERSEGSIKSLILDNVTQDSWEQYDREVLKKLRWENLRKIAWSSKFPLNWERLQVAIRSYFVAPFLPILEEIEVSGSVNHFSSASSTISLMNLAYAFSDNETRGDKAHASNVSPIKSLVIRNCQIYKHTLSCYTQLTVLWLEDPSFCLPSHILYQTLAGNPQLRFLWLGINVLPTDADQWLPTIRLSCLEDLTVGANSCPEWSFRYVTPSKLRKLHFYSNDFIPNCNTLFFEMVARADGLPFLETIVVDSIPRSATEVFLPFIQTCTRLRFISLTQIDSGAQLILRAMACGACPRLERLDIFDCYNVPVSYILDFIKTRLEPDLEQVAEGETSRPIPLRTLCVAGYQYINMDTQNWLKKAVSKFEYRFISIDWRLSFSAHKLKLV